MMNNSTGTIRIEINDEVSLNDTIENTINAYMQLKQASQAGSWEEFGKQMTKLDECINKLNEQKGQLDTVVEENNIQILSEPSMDMSISEITDLTVPVVVQ